MNTGDEAGDDNSRGVQKFRIPSSEVYNELMVRELLVVQTECTCTNDELGGNRDCAQRLKSRHRTRTVSAFVEFDSGRLDLKNGLMAPPGGSGLKTFR